MITEDEPEQAEKEISPAITCAVIFIVLGLLTICIVSVKLVSWLMASDQTPTQVVPLVDLPTDIPTAVPVNYFSTYFPIILVGNVPVPVSEQNWRVTKINYLGYELNGQRYDLATFQRIDSQDTAQAYCIDRGLDAPEIGAEYWLNADGIFIPSNEPVARSIQRFLRIR
jgi:hypothetical protein